MTTPNGFVSCLVVRRPCWLFGAPKSPNSWERLEITNWRHRHCWHFRSPSASRKQESVMNAHRRLGFESLEGRQLLAGNVSVVQAGGGLVITGDDAANVITIESFRDGVVQVRGFSDI